MEETKQCRTCGSDFTVITGRVGRPRLYCSNMCRQQWYIKERTGYTIWEVIEAHGKTCYLCGENVNLAERGDMQPETDHVIPVYLHGTNTIANLRVVHRICNQRKGARIQCPNCNHKFG